MGAKGNQFWKARAKHGRNKIFSDPQMLKDACEEWFQWVEDNPLTEEKVFCFQGEIITHQSPKIRAMTISGLCTFLGIHTTTWQDYRTKDGFSSVIHEAEQIMSNQKFTGAAANMLNANIIARDLGLKDHSVTEFENPLRIKTDPEKLMKERGIPVPDIGIEDIEDGK